LLSVAYKDVPVSDPVKKATWLMAHYSQSWVCTVRKFVVFVSTEQERSVANTKVTGRALVVDPVSIIPVGDFNTKEYHFINTGQGVRACSAETLLGKEHKFRRMAYNDWCPLKGYPSTWWLIGNVVLSWVIVLLLSLLKSSALLRPIAFPFTSLVLFLLSDEIGFLAWANTGDYVSKLTGLFWYLRNKTVLRTNGLVLHDIRPRFRFALRLKLFHRALPVAWTLLLLWTGWAIMLPTDQYPSVTTLSNWIHLGIGIFFTASLPFIWPFNWEMMRNESKPSTMMAYIGRTVPEIVAPRRFNRWSDSHGQFNIFPTFDGIMVFSTNARFIDKV